jgi:predicted RNase H-like HicB family nuclease
MKQYVLPVEVEWQPEGVYYAECTLIPGCHVEGDTIPEALDNLQDAARVLLEIMLERGEPMPSGLETFAVERSLREEVLVSLPG